MTIYGFEDLKHVIEIINNFILIRGDLNPNFVYSIYLERENVLKIINATLKQDNAIEITKKFKAL